MKISEVRVSEVTNVNPNGDRPDLHTDKHDEWDQGGYCNNLVVDFDGCGTICGFRRGKDET